MIYGIGIDIIDNRRVKKVISKFGNKFKNRCFLLNEIKKSEKNLDTANSFSKIYAAKEACAKALGTGFSNGITWKDIEIINDNLGKPGIILHNKAKKKLSKNKDKKYNIKLSISDEKNYSIANVIIFENEK